MAAALAAPFVRGHHTAGDHGTIGSKELPGRFQAKPVQAAESSQVRALKGSVKHEGLAVEKSELDTPILTQGPHLCRTNVPASEVTRANPGYTLHSEEP
ncbi:hypothetical protein QK290_18370, partial [Pseudarthrobacter sp. AL07]|uniref:hypothetical protein n=1 Tax=unclassified Pseudarthrobacter TaxID=2647000 RepID=UPI00249B7F55